jgi:DNA-binding GntR family transcriptional regulator
MDLDRTRPLWKQLAAVLRERIADGTYPVGSRVPSTVELAAEFDVVSSTVQKATAALRAEGLLRGEVGLGTFVQEKPQA